MVRLIGRVVIGFASIALFVGPLEAMRAVSSPPSAACPGTSTSVVPSTTTTTGVPYRPGDMPTGNTVPVGSVVVTTTTATTAPPAPAFSIVPESVSINDGAEFTSSPKVAVAIVGPGVWKGTMGAATRAELSNDGGFKSSKFFDLVDSKATIDWMFESSRQGTFTKILYVRFWNCYGAPAFGSSNLSDDIIFDNTKPIINEIQAFASSARSSVEVLSSKGESAKRANVRLSVRGGDSISGVGSIEIRTSARREAANVALGGAAGSVSSKLRNVKKTIILSTTAKRLQVRLVDRAGNGSIWRTIAVRR